MTPMEQPKHHLTPELLMAYAAGSLPEAFNLLVATHISLCDHCRAELESFEALGGAMLGEATCDMAADSLSATLARLDAEKIEFPAQPAVSGDVPTPLQGYVGHDLASVKWRPVGMGVRQAILPTSRAASARLLHIPAGAAVPDHSHHGTELTLVLKGAFRDECDYFARGDVEIADQDLHHTPVADIHEDCICLAVTDAPLKFSGLIPRLVQPFLRI